MSNCEHKWTRTGFVLASYPPQFPYKCEKCGITKNFRQGEEPMLDACKKCGEFDLDKLKNSAINGHGLSCHGVVFRVISGFYAMKNKGNNQYEGKYINKGSLVEFRYPHSAHCRDVDDDYWMIDPVILAFKCKPFGKIKESVSFENKLNLKEIIEYQHIDIFEESTQDKQEDE